MVRNGYCLSVPAGGTLDLFRFFETVRKDMQDIQQKAVLKVLARETQALYDAKFIDGTKYPNQSILQLATERLQNTLNAVQSGGCGDARFDFQCSLILLHDTKVSLDDIDESDGRHFYCLFNAAYEPFIARFEQYPEVHPYKYFIDGPEKGMSEEENEKHGEFWSQKFEACGWIKTLLGPYVQLTVQPDLSKMELSPEMLKPYFDSVKKRASNYAEVVALRETVRHWLKNTPIEKVEPTALTELFLAAHASSEFKVRKKRILHNTEKGFLPIDVGNLTLVDASFVPEGGVPVA